MDVWLQRGYEQLADFRSSAGWLVVDVGANVGFFTLRQVALGARVIALEPNPEARARLASTVERNRLASRVQVLPFAAGRTSGMAELSVGAATVTGTVLVGVTPAERDRFSVEVRALDDILAAEPHVDLLKIDTEGAEVEVLAGAAATLQRTQRVVLEWHTATLRAEAGVLLQAAGFHAVFAHGAIDYYRR
jgi:FkbM family methyltransferase